MLRDGSRDVISNEHPIVGWDRSSQPAATAAQGDWREVHERLHRNARERAALDANEAYWLREAERLQIWRPLGMVSIPFPPRRSDQADPCPRGHEEAGRCCGANAGT